MERWSSRTILSMAVLLLGVFFYIYLALPVATFSNVISPTHSHDVTHVSSPNQKFSTDNAHITAPAPHIITTINSKNIGEGMLSQSPTYAPTTIMVQQVPVITTANIADKINIPPEQTAATVKTDKAERSVFGLCHEASPSLLRLYHASLDCSWQQGLWRMSENGLVVTLSVALLLRLWQTSKDVLSFQKSSWTESIALQITLCLLLAFALCIVVAAPTKLWPYCSLLGALLYSLYETAVLCQLVNRLQHWLFSFLITNNAPCSSLSTREGEVNDENVVVHWPYFTGLTLPAISGVGKRSMYLTFSLLSLSATIGIIWLEIHTWQMCSVPYHDEEINRGADHNSSAGTRCGLFTYILLLHMLITAGLLSLSVSSCCSCLFGTTEYRQGLLLPMVLSLQVLNSLHLSSTQFSLIESEKELVANMRDSSLSIGNSASERNEGGSDILYFCYSILSAMAFLAVALYTLLGGVERNVIIRVVQSLDKALSDSLNSCDTKMLTDAKDIELIKEKGMERSDETEIDEEAATLMPLLAYHGGRQQVSEISPDLSPCQSPSPAITEDEKLSMMTASPRKTNNSAFVTVSVTPQKVASSSYSVPHTPSTSHSTSANVSAVNYPSLLHLPCSTLDRLASLLYWLSPSNTAFSWELYLLFLSLLLCYLPFLATDWGLSPMTLSQALSLERGSSQQRYGSHIDGVSLSRMAEWDVICVVMAIVTSWVLNWFIAGFALYQSYDLKRRYDEAKMIIFKEHFGH